MTDLETRPHEGRPVPEPRGEPEAQRMGSPIGVAVLVGLVALAGIGGGWPLLVVIGSILLVVFLHELGHFLTAKWAGMKVTEFFIGFGPKIWSFKRGETEYGIKAIWVGAYVKIVGMHNLDEFDPSDTDRTYMTKPYWRRVSVAVAGSTMHFLIALLVLFVSFAWVGVPGGEFEPGQGPWVVRDTPPAGTPAAEAGIVAGDQIVSLDGTTLTTFDEFTNFVKDRPGEEITFVVERGGELIETTVALADEHPDFPGVERGFFGVSATQEDLTRSVPSALGASFQELGRLSVGTVTDLGRVLSPSGLANLGSQLFDGDDEPEAAPSPGGVPREPSADDNRPVSIIGVADIGADLVRDEPRRFLYLLVVLNVFIGIFNLVPLLPLDGGHLAIATYEKIRSMFRKGEPYHVDVVKLLPLTYAVVLVLVFLGVSTIFLDITDPIGG